MAIVTSELVGKQDTLALRAELVLGHAWALFKQVLLDLFDLNDLLALPAAGQHRALLPVVDIERFLVELVIPGVAEVASWCSTILLIYLLGRLGLVLLVFLWPVTRGLSSINSCLLALPADVGLDGLLLPSNRFFPWLLGGHSVALVDLSKLGHQGTELSRSESLVVLGNLATAHGAVELAHAVVGRKPDIVCSVDDSLHGVSGRISLLVVRESVLLEQTVKELVLGND